MVPHIMAGYCTKTTIDSPPYPLVLGGILPSPNRVSPILVGGRMGPQLGVPLFWCPQFWGCHLVGLGS